MPVFSRIRVSMKLSAFNIKTLGIARVSHGRVTGVAGRKDAEERDLNIRRVSKMCLSAVFSSISNSGVCKIYFRRRFRHVSDFLSQECDKPFFFNFIYKSFARVLPSTQTSSDLSYTNYITRRKDAI